MPRRNLNQLSVESNIIRDQSIIELIDENNTPYVVKFLEHSICVNRQFLIEQGDSPLWLFENEPSSFIASSASYAGKCFSPQGIPIEELANDQPNLSRED